MLVRPVRGSTGVECFDEAHAGICCVVHHQKMLRRVVAVVVLAGVSGGLGPPLLRAAWGADPAGTRAVQLPDNLFDSYFLSVFGRPDAASACECERSSESSLAQCLHMLNSQEILGKTAGQRAKDLAKDKRPHADRIKELYLVALSREPSKEETETLLAHIEKKASNAQTAYEDIVWALINSPAFLFNH